MTLSQQDFETAFAQMEAHRRNPPDTDTVEGIKQECLFLASNKFVNNPPSLWGACAAAMVDHLVASTETAPQSLATLEDVVFEAVPRPPRSAR